MMRILFVGGGTGGHINPALAVAGYVRASHPEAKILYAGTPFGMEAELVPKAGFEMAMIAVRGFERKLNWKNFKHNLKAVGHLTTAGHRAKQIIREFRPDLVVGTGGYVSGPVVRAACQLGVPTMIHEQNAFPGVTNKILSKRVDKVLLAVEKAKDYLDPDMDYAVVGNPVREEIIFYDRDRARRELGITDEEPMILSFGGSLGAKRINEAIADVIAWHYRQAKLWHFHATGSYGVDYLPELLEERHVNLKNNHKIHITEYIHDMPRVLAACDLVIGRAGAITLSEIEAAGKASILIPSPNVSENHQYHNAMVLQNANAAVVIEEKDLTGEVLVRTVKKLVNDPEKLKTLGKNARSIAVIDSNERIYREMMELIERKKAQEKKRA